MLENRTTARAADRFARKSVRKPPRPAIARIFAEYKNMKPKAARLLFTGAVPDIVAVVTIPWHITGLMGQPRRVAVFDYSDPFLAPMAPLVIISVIGGAILLLSAILLIVILARSQFGERRLEAPLRYALAVNPPKTVPPSLNGFALWNTIVFVLMVCAYGYPIGQFLFLKSLVPAYEVTLAPTSAGGR
jgi:cytochrome c oxidase subunit I